MRQPCPVCFSRSRTIILLLLKHLYLVNYNVHTVTKLLLLQNCTIQGDVKLAIDEQPNSLLLPEFMWYLFWHRLLWTFTNASQLWPDEDKLLRIEGKIAARRLTLGFLLTPLLSTLISELSCFSPSPLYPQSWKLSKHPNERSDYEIWGLKERETGGMSNLPTMS